MLRTHLLLRRSCIISTLSVKGHICTGSAYAKQSRQLHLISLVISLVGTWESVRASLAAMQHGHSAVLKSEDTTLVNLGFQGIKVIQERLPNGVFYANALGQGVIQGDVLVLKQNDSLSERFYTALLTKSNLSLHSSWQETLLEIAQKGNLLTKLPSYSVQAYALGDGLGAFETQVRHARVRGDLPEIGEPACA